MSSLLRNNIDSLPPELLRKGRFDEIFFVDLPTRSEREAIWRLHLRRQLRPGTRVSDGFAVTDGATSRLAEASEGFSGAEIEQAVLIGCFEAFAERRPITVDDLLHAITSTVPLSVTQAEQIVAIRRWAEKRAVAATPSDDMLRYTEPADAPETDVSSWRGGRALDF